MTRPIEDLLPERPEARLRIYAWSTPDIPAYAFPPRPAEPTKAWKTGMWERALSQMGSLGSGNHFVEVCLDEADKVWMLDEAVTLLSLRYNVIPSSTRGLSPCESMEVPKP